MPKILSSSVLLPITHKGPSWWGCSVWYFTITEATCHANRKLPIICIATPTPLPKKKKKRRKKKSSCCINFCYFLITGIGMGILMESTYVILVYYFKKNLARANGLASAAVGVSPFYNPTVISSSYRLLWMERGSVNHRRPSRQQWSRCSYF